jgi:glutaredoxin
MRLRYFALLLLLPAYCAQAQYKWVDADGHASYGDQPPKDARNVVQLGPVNGALDSPDSLSTLPYEIRRAAQDFPVTLYARADCHVCDDARAFLRARAIPYAERSVVTAADIEAFHLLGGGDQLPAVTIGRQVLRGYEPVSWGETLSAAGYPQGVSLPRSWRWASATPLAPPARAPAGDSTDTGTDAAGNAPAQANAQASGTAADAR